MAEVGKFFTDEERDKKIKQERNKLRRLTKARPKEERTVLYPLIDNLAFTVVQLEELRAMIKAEGYYSEYKNGANQWGQKKSIASDTINQVGKSYVSYLGRLHDYMPNNGSADELSNWDKEHRK